MIYDGRNQYLYDAEGHMCAAKGPSPPSGWPWTLTGYFYDGVPVDRSSSTGRDADGTRVAKGNLAHFTCDFNPSDPYVASTNQGFNGFTPTYSYVLGLKGEQVTELTVSGGAGSYLSAWAHTNVFGGLGLLATYAWSDTPNQSSTYFALNDWLGTRRAEVGAEGCVSTFTSMPYGNDLLPSTLSGYSPCPDATEHHFTGKERDTESGNDYFEARYYSSAMGRFMSPDWSAKEEPVPYAQLDDPQSLNLYAYVRNNPLTRVDADGHCCEDAVDFFGGLLNALGSDNAMGAGRVDQTTTAGQIGASVGDAIATVQGFGEMTLGTQAIFTGGAEALVTSPAIETGAPAAGLALAAAGAAVDIHGAKVATQGLVHLAQDVSEGGSGTKPSSEDQAGKGVQGGKKDRSGQGSIDQLKGVKEAQKDRTKKGGYRISTKKSEQDVDTATKKHATNLKDAQKHYDE